MRLYSSQHRFYAGIDLHARTMVEMAVPPRRTTRPYARAPGIHVGAVFDQQTHDLRIAVSGRVVDRLIAAAVRCGCLATSATNPRGVRKKDRRQEPARAIVRRPDVGIQSAVLDEQRDDRLVVGHLARVMHHIAIVRRPDRRAASMSKRTTGSRRQSPA